MNTIQILNSDYKDVVNFFTEEKVINRYTSLVEMYEQFIIKQKIQDKVRLNRLTLLYVVMDYFSDVMRIKEFHKDISLINEIKIIAYESSWLLKRKPIQLIVDDDKNFVFVNEDFIFFIITQYLSEKSKRGKDILYDKKMSPFWDTLIYYLKFRVVNPQALELMLTSFHAGQIAGPSLL